MPDRPTMPRAEARQASRQLDRLLHILPAAAAEGGADLMSLARELGVEPGEILRDLQDVAARAFYMPPGTPDDILMDFTSERVEVHLPGAFDRPVRLGPLEALCLAVALEGADDLLARLQDSVVAPEPEGGSRSGISPADSHGSWITDVVPDDPEFRDEIARAARGHRKCRVLYLKPHAPEPDTRVIHPHELIHAEGHWYVLAYCELRRAARVFRVDRMLGVDVLEEEFEPGELPVPPFLSDLRVFIPFPDPETGAEPPVAVVRYSPSVARWIEEHEETDPLPDGGVSVRWSVADPGWLVRHVLAYGGEAEVTEPAELRLMVRDVAASVWRGAAD
jgi:proteasome accessory factor C